MALAVCGGPFGVDRAVGVRICGPGPFACKAGGPGRGRFILLWLSLSLATWLFGPVAIRITILWFVSMAMVVNLLPVGGILLGGVGPRFRHRGGRMGLIFRNLEFFDEKFLGEIFRASKHFVCIGGNPEMVVNFDNTVPVIQQSYWNHLAFFSYLPDLFILFDQ